MKAVTAYDQTIASQEFQFLENSRRNAVRNETIATSTYKHRASQKRPPHRLACVSSWSR